MPDELDESRSPGWEEYVSIAIRRRWWILLPLFLCWVSVWAVSWLIPPTYESEAVILVEEQKVPDKFVEPNVNLNLQDRLHSITQQILSRSRLQAIIDRFGLYSRPHGIKALMKYRDPIDQMRGDVKVDLMDSPGHRGEFSAFKIHYSTGSPQLAQRVNQELTSLFVEANEQTDRQLSANTTAFLESQLADARAKMEVQEARVAAFKTKHVGELPVQMESNVQILAGLQSQLENTQHALNASKQQRVYLESLLQQYQSTRPRNPAGGAAPLVAQSSPLEKELLDLRLRLQDLRTRYTDNYPDVAALKDKIASVERTLSQDGGKLTTVATGPAGNDELSGSTTTMMQIQSQLNANQAEIENDGQHEKDLESQTTAYQARLNMTPETEQELVGISRGYDESKSNYDSLLQKQMQSELATSLEQRQQGEQFRVLDAPTLPDKTSAPNHFRMSLAGLVLGSLVGILLTAFLELTDARVRQEKDLQGIVPTRILVSIPQLSTPRENRARWLGHFVEFVGVLCIVAAIAIGNLYALYKG